MVVNKMAKIIQLENKVDADVSGDDNAEYERYIPVEQSIIGSLLEVREMIAGRKPKITWDEFSVELREMIEADFPNKGLGFRGQWLNTNPYPLITNN